MINKIKIKIERILEIIIDKEVKKNIVDLYKYRNNKKKILIFFLVLPLSFIFVIINLIVTLIGIFSYTIIIIIKYFISNIKKNKNKTFTIRYKKRFKFLKNYYIIVLEKILITFPKKKAYLIVYIIFKKIIKKEDGNIEIEYINKWLKSILNRIVIRTIFGAPFIVIKINKDLTDLIWDLKEFNYEDNLAYIETILLNIFKNVTPDYNKMIEKLKIKIKNKKIKFNSEKEILKALKYKKNFSEDFSNIKKKCVFGSVKHKIENEKNTESHPTLMLEGLNKKIAYINETSSNRLKYFKYLKEKNEYIEGEKENNHCHKGSINSKKTTYYTGPIESEKDNILIQRVTKDKFLKESVYNENTNNITASFLTNLQHNIINTKKINNKFKLIEEEGKEKKLMDWIRENKDKYEPITFETFLRIEFFWEENKEIIKEMKIEDKIELAEKLGMNEIDLENDKDANFIIFKSYIDKEIKIK